MEERVRRTHHIHPNIRCIFPIRHIRWQIRGNLIQHAQRAANKVSHEVTLVFFLAGVMNICPRLEAVAGAGRVL